MKFTLVSTVFNEASRLDQTISDLKNQSLQPSEIIITDAGSTDGTVDILTNWKNASDIPITILVQPRCNVAEGRNRAIQAATHDLIVSTDFGCRFEKDWLQHLTAPFADPRVKITGGAFAVLEEDIHTLPARAAYILSGGYRVDPSEPWFIPSSRSIAYYKEVYNKVGGYCEWLTLAADDLVFGKQFLAEGYRFFPVHHPGVFWGRHTKAIGYIKEAFRYGLGDGEARVNKRSCLSNLIETAFRYLLFMSLIVTPALVTFGLASKWVLLLNLLFLPGLRSYVGFFRTWQKLKSPKYNGKVFLYGLWLLERTRLSYLKGYFQGYFRATPFQKEQARLLQLRLK